MHLTELRSAIPPMLNTPELRFQVDEARKFAAMAEIAERLTTSPGPEVESVNDTDGVRVNTADGWWLLRASNTSPKLIMRVEADTEKRVKEIRKIIEERTIEGNLKREIASNIKRLKDIKCYRGVRHMRRLPVNGQRTKTNSRTVRGNVRNTMGSGRRKESKT